jgi:hypothetical protein
VTSPNLKKPEMIPPAEIRQAILHLVAEHVGLGREEVTVLVARALGFRVTSAKLKDGIERTLERMIEEQTVALRDEKLFEGSGSESRAG